ncbi:hypothetical protein WN48_05486 [Eufriesea mexicana]|uniref:Uncharacterized protein n=1 Tax=Eufriesea mexicana TaxID=516756 RepID=A0A310S9B2_9HYME|nr:hypothetical protein WN48_05486 [Eufriesea mexicana]
MFVGFSPDNIICNEKFCCRDFNLLSFIEKATEDEEESVKKNQMKSIVVRANQLIII